MSRKRKNNSSPVSLFAFQDIITSITGIMLLIVIIFLLQLINSSTPPPPKNSLIEADKMLDKELAEIIKQEKIIAAINLSGIKKIGDIKTLKHKMATLKTRLSKIEKERKKLDDEKKAVAEEINKQKTKNDKLKKKILLTKSEKKKEENKQKNIKAKLQSTLKKSLFAISSSSGKKPIFIICGEDRIKIIADQGHEELILEDTSSNMQGIIKKLAVFLQKRSHTKEYLSIMVTPESAGYIRHLPIIVESFDTSYVPIPHIDIIQKMPEI